MTAVQEERWLWLNRQHGFYAYAVQSLLDIDTKGSRTVAYLSALNGQDVGFEHPYIASGKRSRAGSQPCTWGVGGLPYRIALCVTGVIVATFSVTGVVIWWKKRQGRRRVEARQHALPAAQQPQHGSSNTRTDDAVLGYRQAQDGP